MASSFLTGVALGDRLAGCVCPWGFPGLLPLFLGGLPVLRCGMVCCVASGLVVVARDQWMKVWRCICFCWPVICGSWAILSRGWVLWCTFSLPVTTLINYLINFTFNVINFTFNAAA